MRRRILRAARGNDTSFVMPACPASFSSCVLSCLLISDCSALRAEGNGIPFMSASILSIASCTGLSVLKKLILISDISRLSRGENEERTSSSALAISESIRVSRSGEIFGSILLTIFISSSLSSSISSGFFTNFAIRRFLKKFHKVFHKRLKVGSLINKFGYNADNLFPVAVNNSH